MPDYVIMGIAPNDGVKSVRYPVDKNFAKHSHYCHERHFGSGGPRWRYRFSTKTVYWYQSVEQEIKDCVDIYILNRYNQIADKHVFTVAGSRAWKDAHVIK